MTIPHRPKPDEPIGTGRMLVGGLIGLGMLALGVGLIVASLHEFWLVSRLRTHGRLAQADVYLEGVVGENQRIAFREYTTQALSYSYSFQVGGHTYGGSVSSSNDQFAESLQPDQANDRDPRFPLRVGSVPVTYLPADPSWHRFGRVDQRQVAAAQGKVWLGIPMGLLFTLVGGVLVLAFFFMLRDKWLGRTEVLPAP